MVALVTSTLVVLLIAGIVVAYSKRRPVGAPLTWGEAMAAAFLVFFAMLWAYGVVPHQWLTLADNELQWRADRTFLQSGDLGGVMPFTVTYKTFRDLVATGIYGVMLGGQIFLWSLWQNRGKVKTREIPSSAYGRPLVRPES